MAELLISYEADINFKERSGLTPLHIACQYRRTESVSRLLSKGAKVHVQDQDGWTPLHYACFSGKVEVVRLLLANGANVNVKDNFNRTLMQVTPKYVADEMVKLLVESSSLSRAQHLPASIFATAVLTKLHNDIFLGS